MSEPEEIYIGLDVGRTIRGALIRSDGAILKQHRVVSEVSNPRLFIDQLIAVINDLRASTEAGHYASAVGVGWAGLVNKRAQRIEVTPNLADACPHCYEENVARIARGPASPLSISRHVRVVVKDYGQPRRLLYLRV